MVATDRISAFDHILKNKITKKGAILTQRHWHTDNDFAAGQQDTQRKMDAILIETLGCQCDAIAAGHQFL